MQNVGMRPNLGRIFFLVHLRNISNLLMISNIMKALDTFS